MAGRVWAAAIGSVLFRHAFQFAHLRRFLRNRHDALLEHRALERAKKSARRRELHFLRRVEPAIRRVAFFHDGDGFLVGQTDRQSENSKITSRLVGRQRLHESEHARLL